MKVTVFYHFFFFSCHCIRFKLKSIADSFNNLKSQSRFASFYSAFSHKALKQCERYSIFLVGAEILLGVKNIQVKKKKKENVVSCSFERYRVSPEDVEYTLQLFDIFMAYILRVI